MHLPVDTKTTIKLVQFTDTHIFADPDERFDWVDTAATLKRIIEFAGTEEDWPPHLALVTGDLVHDPVTKAYQRFYSLFGELEVPVCCLPGNHDDPDCMDAHLNSGTISTTKIITAGNWRILLLNTWMRGTHAGHLPEEELNWLDTMLKKQSQGYALICLHHPPVSIASPWMDAMALDNPDDLFTVLDRYQHVKGLVWGNIHQEYTAQRKGVALYGTPSTCVQFTPHADRYRRDDLAPACRWLQLGPGNEINTWVSYADME